MTYDASELSVQDGFPTELYLFAVGPDQFAFTSGDQAVNYNGDTYEPAEIERTNPAQNDETTAANLQISVPRDNEVASLFRTIVPSQTVFVSVFRFHRDTLTPAVEDVIVFWQGRIRSVVWEGSTAKMESEPLIGILKRDGLRAMYQSTCNHMLYGPDCTKDRELFRVPFTVDSVSTDGLTITSSQLGAAAANFFDGGGFVERGGVDRRTILSGGGGGNDTIVILYPFPDLLVGETLDAFAGCDRTRETCNTKFDNLDNFGGWPFIPSRNPFESGLR